MLLELAYALQISKFQCGTFLMFFEWRAFYKLALLDLTGFLAFLDNYIYGLLR